MKTHLLSLILIFSLFAGTVFSQTSGEGNTLSVNIKKKKPVIEWKSPALNDASITTLSTQILANIKCEDPITSIELFINGSPQRGFEPVKSGNGYLVKIDKTITLNVGTNTFYIVAKTAKETVTSETKNIIAREPASRPVISWISPVEKQISQETTVRQIQACIKSEIPVKAVEIYVNGSLLNGYNVVASTDEACTALVDNEINLKAGPNTIYIVASNESGSVTSETKTIIVQAPTNQPVITWISPTKLESAQEAPSIQIKACVKSETALNGVEIYVNGGMMRGYVVAESSDIGCAAVVDKKINLQEGENSIYIVAKNENGSDTSETIYINYGQGIKHQKRVALIIGNAEYKNVGTLKNPKNDAADIAKALKRLNFDVELVADANFKQLGMAINRFGTRVENADISFFYYAGHGVQVNGNNYLIPVDADIKEENQVEFECVDANRALAYMESGDSKVNIIVMDACRNNPFERSWKRGIGGGRGLASMNAPVGSIIAYATQPGNTAADGSGENGLYTSALLEYIEKPELSLYEIFMNVRVKVLNDSGKQQQPWESSSLTGHVYLLK